MVPVLDRPLEIRGRVQSATSFKPAYPRPLTCRRLMRDDVGDAIPDDGFFEIVDAQGLTIPHWSSVVYVRLRCVLPGAAPARSDQRWRVTS